MTKNVTVTDEKGTYVGSTYPKRAKGLVKNGRALFVDDCTIRLSQKTEPSDDILHQSEVKQMNYIYFNPREWSSEQTQYQNGNGFYQSGSNRQVNVERSFINDFDDSLVESLMFGSWNESYVRMISDSYSLLPNSEYCFVFWLNGGENDKNSEICQLQITFFGNPANCYTYKLNRNYIKPLLHKQGWELYSIPFTTPSSGQESVDTRFSFVAGNAPMAIKPAKEPSFYKDWEDEPDEFAMWRPQRHNLVFENGWPSINMYGGDKYSTEVLCKKRVQTAKSFAPNTLKPGARNHQTQRRAELAEMLSEFQERHDELTSRREELSERRYDLQTRYQELQECYDVDEEEKTQLDAGFDDSTEWESGFSSLLALEAQLSCASELVSNQDLPIEAAEGVLVGIESQLDSVEELCDSREQVLDDLEELLDDLEDEAEDQED